MGSLHQLPTEASAYRRILEQLVGGMIGAHPDKAVAKIWAGMAHESMSRYPGPPLPTKPAVDLDSVKGLTLEQEHQIHVLTQAWLEHYFNDVRNQMMSIHRDFLGLQRRIADLEHEQERHKEVTMEYTVKSEKENPPEQ